MQHLQHYGITFVERHTAPLAGYSVVGLAEAGGVFDGKNPRVLYAEARVNVHAPPADLPETLGALFGLSTVAPDEMQYPERVQSRCAQVLFPKAHHLEITQAPGGPLARAVLDICLPVPELRPLLLAKRVSWAWKPRAGVFGWARELKG